MQDLRASNCTRYIRFRSCSPIADLRHGVPASLPGAGPACRSLALKHSTAAVVPQAFRVAYAPLPRRRRILAICKARCRSPAEQDAVEGRGG